MTIAIMQPYLFPYIGYFQLIKSVDKFVIYDDVNYIKQGWINRNRILLNGKEYVFTIPVENQSSFLKINEVLIDEKQYVHWKKKFIKTITLAYQKAPYFNEVSAIYENVLNNNNTKIASIASNSILETCRYLGINTTIQLTSSTYNNDCLKSAERIIDICIKEKANKYINPPGGGSLYSKEEFKQHGISLYFLQPISSLSYEQFSNQFIPWLSVIDVMMFNSKEQITQMLNNFNFL